MIVRSVELEGFRSYTAARAEFSEGVNVITGANAQGKTNLLEALYLLTGSHSFRTRFDRDLIAFEAQEARLQAALYSESREQTVELRLARGKKRAVFANNVRLKTSSELAGKVTAVVFCPDDLYLIRSGAAQRRKLLNMSLCQLRPRYAAALASYQKLYDDKSRILKDWHEKPSLLDALDAFNLQMCKASAEIMYYRANFTALLAEQAGEIHRQFSAGKEELGLAYATMKTVADPKQKPAELLGPIIEHQRQHREAEIASCQCLSGVHKDDLLIDINGAPAKQYASQGQTRTAALSIKMAQRRLHAADRGEEPILLLDDVLSELDAGRQDFVLNLIGQGQVFITCCAEENIAARTGGRVLTVSGGTIRTE